MDVRCPECETHYVFDASHVGDRGVSVKCTACRHVFRVFAEGGVRGWMIRHADGSTVEFKELTTLQRWIVESRIRRKDEISRNGSTWRPLGDIKELEPFFSVTEKAERLAELLQHTPLPAVTESADDLKENFLDGESSGSIPVQLTERRQPDVDQALVWDDDEPPPERRAPPRPASAAAPLAPMGILRADAEFPSAPPPAVAMKEAPQDGSGGWMRPFLWSVAAGLALLVLGSVVLVWVAPARAAQLLDTLGLPRIPFDPRPLSSLLPW